MDPRSSRRGRLGVLRHLGPGLTTGAADDDPSGIGTYSQLGASTSPKWLQQLETIEGLGTRLRRETGVQQICRLTAEVAASLLPHDQIRVYLVTDDKR